MRRAPIWLLGVGALLLCAVATALFGPRGDEAPPRVEFEASVPERAILREPTRLEVRVANRGTSAIRDLGVKMNRGYANALTVVETQPRATIDDASTEKRLYFGPLEVGQSAVYRITMVPQRAGEANLTLRLVAARRGFDPLPLTDAATGRAEITAVTAVLDERPATPTPVRR